MFIKLRTILQQINHSKHTKCLAMADCSGKKLTDVLSCLETFAPLHLAEPWDNVGLLVDPMENREIKNILLTNDLTEDIVEEAIKLNTGLIISYHPNIFTGLKSVGSKSWKERIVVQCIKNKIAVFSPHTSWDACKEGVNVWLANALPLSSCKPIKETANDPDCGAGRVCMISGNLNLEDAVQKIKTHIGIPYLRLALAKNKSISSTISTLAVCAGSGSSVLNGTQADLYLTGEMSHHDVLNATQNGIHVVLCEHSNSERGFLKIFQKKLEYILGNEVKVITSIVDKDPLQIV